MGVIGCCGKLCAVSIVPLAAFVGWVLSYDIPMEPIFKLAFKLQGLSKPGTEAVPADFAAQPRPVGEMFLPLASGARMPANGIGMCCRPTAYDDESVFNSILWYLLLGGRQIDTADVYGNHVAIGQALRAAEKRGVPRSEVFITTKVYSDTFGYATTKAAVRRWLKELGVDYVDLVLLHLPRRFHPRAYLAVEHGWEDEFRGYDCKTVTGCHAETWKALSELIDEGAVRDAGVSNFKISYMQKLQALGLKPISVQQLQYHPWAPKTVQDIVAFCHRNKIAVTAYFSLGGMQNSDKVLNMDALNAAAAAHRRPPGQVLLRWALEQNVSIIPGTGNPKHMRENLDVYSFSLTAEDMKRLNALASDPVADEFAGWFLYDW